MWLVVQLECTHCADARFQTCAFMLALSMLTAESNDDQLLLFGAPMGWD